MNGPLHDLALHAAREDTMVEAVELCGDGGLGALAARVQLPTQDLIGCVGFFGGDAVADSPRDFLEHSALMT